MSISTCPTSSRSGTAQGMVVVLPVLSLAGLPGIRAYLRASDQYLNSPLYWRKMSFPFPTACPVCARPACAEWKGYYVRGIQDVAHGSKRVAIRHGRCRYRNVRFSLLPDFLIPRLRLTRRAVETIQAGLRGRGITLRAAIDTCFSPWNEHNYVPVSTAHFALRRHAFEAWWARHQEHRDILTVRPRRAREASTPKRFESVLRAVEPLGRAMKPRSSLSPRMRGPPAAPIAS